MKEILDMVATKNPGERTGENTWGFQKDLTEKICSRPVEEQKKLYSDNQSSAIASLPKSSCYSTSKSDNS